MEDEERKEQCKEFYKKEIINTINKIEDVHFLMYLYHFIDGKNKAWH